MYNVSRSYLNDLKYWITNTIIIVNYIDLAWGYININMWHASTSFFAKIFEDIFLPFLMFIFYNNYLIK